MAHEELGLKHRGRGFALIEVMIASAILIVAGFVVADFVLKSKLSTKTLQSDDQCHVRAMYVIDTFKAADNKHFIDNWHPSGAQVRPTAAGISHYERYQFPAVFPSPSPPSTLSYDVINTWQQINDGTNWALALFNSNKATYCSTTANTAPAGVSMGGLTPLSPTSPPLTTLTPNGFGPNNLLYPPGARLNNEAVYVNVMRHDQISGAADCQFAGNLRLPPIGINSVNPNTANQPMSSHTSLQVTAIVVYTDNTGRYVKCDATTDLKADGDNIRPSPVPAPADILPAGGCPAGSTKCFCDPNTDLCLWNSANKVVPTTSPPLLCTGSTVIAGAAYGEPGALFGCELDYATSAAALPPAPLPAPNGSFVPCNNFTATINGAGVTGSIAKIHGIATLPNVTGIQVTFSGLPDGYYVLFIKAFDSAQNDAKPSGVLFSKFASCATPAPSPSPSPSPAPSVSPGGASPSPTVPPIPCGSNCANMGGIGSACLPTSAFCTWESFDTTNCSSGFSACCCMGCTVGPGGACKIGTSNSADCCIMGYFCDTITGVCK